MFWFLDQFQYFSNRLEKNLSGEKAFFKIRSDFKIILNNIQNRVVSMCLCVSLFVSESRTISGTIGLILCIEIDSLNSYNKGILPIRYFNTFEDSVTCHNSLIPFDRF